MLLQILLQGILLRDNPRVVVVVEIDIVILQRVVVRRRMIRGRRRRHRSDAALVLPILCIVQLLVIEIVQREVRRVLLPPWRIHGAASVTRTERQHRTHIAGTALLLLLLLL